MKRKRQVRRDGRQAVVGDIPEERTGVELGREAGRGEKNTEETQ